MNAVEVNQPLGEFAVALRRHDLDFQYSDDGRVYRKGCQEYDALLRMARELDRADVLVVVEIEANKRLPKNSRRTFLEHFALDMGVGR